jgi:hypothetical protein
MKIDLKLELESDEYFELLKIYGCNNKVELKEKINGALNNWVLEMLLDQEPNE